MKTYLSRSREVLGDPELWIGRQQIEGKHKLECSPYTVQKIPLIMHKDINTNSLYVYILHILYTYLQRKNHFSLMRSLGEKASFFCLAQLFL